MKSKIQAFSALSLWYDIDFSSLSEAWTHQHLHLQIMRLLQSLFLLTLQLKEVLFHLPLSALCTFMAILTLIDISEYTLVRLKSQICSHVILTFGWIPQFVLWFPLHLKDWDGDGSCVTMGRLWWLQHYISTGEHGQIVHFSFSFFPRISYHYPNAFHVTTPVAICRVCPAIAQALVQIELTCGLCCFLGYSDHWSYEGMIKFRSYLNRNTVCLSVLLHNVHLLNSSKYTCIQQWHERDILQNF